jgi:hypothetical protein
MEQLNQLCFDVRQSIVAGVSGGDCKYDLVLERS